MLASSANIPDNIKWAKYYCQYLSPEGCVFISRHPQTETPDNSSLSSAAWREDTLSWKPSDQHLLLMMCFRPIFGLPFLVTKCRLFNQDLKTHASNLNMCARLRGDFVLWRSLMRYTELLGKLNRPTNLKQCSSSVKPTICSQPLVNGTVVL